MGGLARSPAVQTSNSTPVDRRMRCVWLIFKSGRCW